MVEIVLGRLGLLGKPWKQIRLRKQTRPREQTGSQEWVARWEQVARREQAVPWEWAARREQAAQCVMHANARLGFGPVQAWMARLGPWWNLVVVVPLRL
ncbi:hypothetical protein ACFX16_024276 [Malus domestica]